MRERIRAEGGVKAWTAAGFGIFLIVSGVVGVRLLLLWRRTRGLPELLMGIGVLGIGPVGFSLSLAGQLLVPLHPAVAVGCAAAGQLAANAGALAKYVFNWRVYHPQSAAARLGVAAAVLVMLGIFVDLTLRGFPMDRPGLRSLPLVVALLWGSGEALRYRALMRRRARVGLGDPVVENRFLLWGIAAGSAGVGSAIGMVAGLRQGAAALLDPAILTLLSLLGLVAAVGLWLAFLPPRFYSRRFSAGVA